MQLRLPDRLLARYFLAPVLIGRRDRCFDAERRLAILNVAEDALRRCKDESPRRRRRLHVCDQTTRGVEIDPTREVGRVVGSWRDDGRQMDHSVYALQGMPDRFRTSDVTRHEAHTSVDGGCDFSGPARVEIERDDIVAFLKQRRQSGDADVAQRTCQQHLHPSTSRCARRCEFPKRRQKQLVHCRAQLAKRRGTGIARGSEDAFQRIGRGCSTDRKAKTGNPFHA